MRLCKLQLSLIADAANEEIVRTDTCLFLPHPGCPRPFSRLHKRLCLLLNSLTTAIVTISASRGILLSLGDSWVGLRPLQRLDGRRILPHLSSTDLEHWAGMCTCPPQASA